MEKKEFKGTGGNWYITNFLTVFSNDKYGRYVADCDVSTFISDEEKNANAQLIAAAPELLEALIELVIINQQRLDGAGSWSCSKLWFRKTWNATERAVKAINKALV